VTEKGQEKLYFKCRIEVEIRVRKRSCQSLDGDFAFPEFLVLFIKQKIGIECQYISYEVISE